jgi:hypothetical protein
MKLFIKGFASILLERSVDQVAEKNMNLLLWVSSPNMFVRWHYLLSTLCRICIFAQLRGFEPLS